MQMNAGDNLLLWTHTGSPHLAASGGEWNLGPNHYIMRGATNKLKS